MLKLFTIKESFIKLLAEIDSRVLSNKQGKRPYVGVVYDIHNLKYYVPLTSPKPKHLKMGNSKDFHKILGGKYGVININNMIPVTDEALIEIDINNEPDRNYRLLLQNQIIELNKIQTVLKKKVQTVLHCLRMTTFQQMICASKQDAAISRCLRKK